MVNRFKSRGFWR